MFGPNVAEQAERTLQTRLSECVRHDARDCGDEAGDCVRITGAPGGIELCDGQRPIARVSGRDAKRHCYLVESWTGVATVCIFGQRRIGEIQDINIEMHCQRAFWQVLQGFRHRRHRIDCEGLARDHVQAEASRLCSFPLRCETVLDSQPGYLLGFEERPRPQHIGENIEATRKGECMCHSHPVKCSVGRALRRVDVIVPVDVEQSDLFRSDATKGGDYAKRDCAVPTDHEQRLPTCQQRDQASDQLLDGLGHLTDVLRPGIEAIWAPDLEGQITLVVHVESRCSERINEPGGPEYARSLLLPSGIATRTIRNANDRDGAHSQDRRAGARMSPEASVPKSEDGVDRPDFGKEGTWQT